MDARKLVERLARQERDLRQTSFVAPCVAGGRIRVRLDGLIHELAPRPDDFEGWGVFQAIDARAARLLREASPRQIEAYLGLLRPLRILLCWRLSEGSWLAYPANESDAAQRFGAARPVVVHLVTGADRFDQIEARCDGAAFFFEALDRRADPRTAERLRQAHHDVALVEELAWPGLVPEAKTAYGLALAREMRRPVDPPARGPEADERRLRRALAFGGGDLKDVHDRGDYWVVEWSTRDGGQHSSAISKGDLTVLSSGICLDDRDSDFDLQSLVGVIEQASYWDM